MEIVNEMKVERVTLSNSDLDITNIARVSFGKWKDVFDKSDEKLLKYLVGHKHVSTMFHNYITIELSRHRATKLTMVVLTNAGNTLGLKVSKPNKSGNCLVSYSIYGWCELYKLGFIYPQVAYELATSYPKFVTYSLGDSALENSPKPTFLNMKDYGDVTEHEFISIRFEVPLFVARQLYTHKSFSKNEISARYVMEGKSFYIPKTLRANAENVKQGSSQDAVEDNDKLVTELVESTSLALESYEKLLAGGVCAEQARGILPQDTMTKFIFTGSRSDWEKLVALRLAPNAQKEVRNVAVMIQSILSTT